MLNVYASKSVADAYDQGRELPLETIQTWVDVLQSNVPTQGVRNILDLGCGTGAWTVALRDAFHANVLGVDPAKEMLDVAMSKPLVDVEWKAGSAENIPADDQSFDLVWISDVTHHFSDPGLAYSEISRVLSPNGFLAVRTANREDIETIEWLRYFPEARALDHQRLLYQGEMVEQVESANFTLTWKGRVMQLAASSFSEYCEKVFTRTLSALRLISDESFHEGRARMLDAMNKRSQDLPVFEPRACFVFQKQQRG